MYAYLSVLLQSTLTGVNIMIWRSLMWLLSLIGDAFKMFLKFVIIMVLIICAIVGLGEIVKEELGAAKVRVKESVSAQVDNLSWREMLGSLPDPPLLYVEPTVSSGYDPRTNQYGYQSPEIYKGHLVPLRL